MKDNIISDLYIMKKNNELHSEIKKLNNHIVMATNALEKRNQKINQLQAEIKKLRDALKDQTIQ